MIVMTCPNDDFNGTAYKADHMKGISSLGFSSSNLLLFVCK